MTRQEFKLIDWKNNSKVVFRDKECDVFMVDTDHDLVFIANKTMPFINALPCEAISLPKSTPEVKVQSYIVTVIG